MLGIGFEERGEALDFSIALQEARKVLGLEAVTPSVKSAMPSTPTMPRSAGLIGGSRNVGVVSDRSKPETAATEQEIQHVKRDWSLKEGQMLHVDLAGKNASVRTGVRIEPPSGDGVVASAGSAFTLLPPPPSAKEVREDQQRGVDGVQDEEKTLEELGFDDGEFGEFQ